jgi:ABC-2 type transport system ATP-binding protein
VNVDAVEVADLGREYARRRQPARVALAGFDLTVPVGEVHGLLGPNGAGKTTLCKILSTVLLPTSGTARVFGRDVVTDTKAVRTLVGVVFGGERGLYGRLTARQNLLYWSALYRQPRAVGRARADRLLERLGLTGRADERVETFSRGMKQRLHLARGLIGDPRLVILDEPTVGMDPVAAKDFRSLVRELRDEGRTVLITTHDMAEAEAVCDRVSLIDGGKLLATEDPRTIGGWLTKYERVVAEDVPREVLASLSSVPGVRGVSTEDRTTVVETEARGAAGAVVQALVRAGVTTMSTGRPSLADVYLHVIGDRGSVVR